MKQTYVVHVIKDKTRAFNNPIHDICVVEAEDENEVTRLIANHTFPEAWWKPGVSRCAVVKIIPLMSLQVIAAPKRVLRTRHRPVGFEM